MLTFAWTNQTIFESRLVAASLQAIDPLLRLPLANIFREMSALKMVEQSSHSTAP